MVILPAFCKQWVAISYTQLEIPAHYKGDMQYFGKMEPLTRTEFERLDIRVGTVVEAKEFPRAKKPAYQLTIDFGASLGIKRSSAQVTARYSPENLTGRQVIAVVNFPPKNIAGFISECLVLGIYEANNDVVLLAPASPVSNGLKIG